MENYFIIDKLGEGIRGFVYSAVDKRDGSLRAIKIMDKSESALIESQTYNAISGFTNNILQFPTLYSIFEQDLKSYLKKISKFHWISRLISIHSRLTFR